VTAQSLMPKTSSSGNGENPLSGAQRSMIDSHRELQIVHPFLAAMGKSWSRIANEP
jgi:hypothetical protein